MFINVALIFQAFPSSGFWQNVTCYRVFAPWLIQEEIKYVLYLDSDILCKGPLDDIFADKNIICICNELEGNQSIRLPQLSHYIYCNAGVMKMHIQRSLIGQGMAKLFWMVREYLTIVTLYHYLLNPILGSLVSQE